MSTDQLQLLEEALPGYTGEEWQLPDECSKIRIEENDRVNESLIFQHTEASVAASSVLTDRWFKCHLSAKQLRYLHSKTRFNVVAAGRRSFKTEGAKRRLVKKAIKETRFDYARFIATAPTAPQATKIHWFDLKRMVPSNLIMGGVNGIREAEKSIPLVNGMEIAVLGLDVPERVEGSPLAHILVDETDNIKPRAWPENISPALTDTQGTADFIGVPEGRLLLWNMKEAMDEDEFGEWMYHHWTSEEVLHLYLGFRADRENLPPELAGLDPVSLGYILAERELKSARNRMDRVTYNREYRASFDTIQGRAYYDFDRKIHGIFILPHQPEVSLDIMLDFNVEPGIAAVTQEFPTNFIKGEVGFTGVISEVWIESGSNTKKVCRKIGKQYGPIHKGPVRVFGDATGGARGSAKVEGSDWDLARKTLAEYFPNVTFHYPRRNPPERSRVNSMNSRIMSVNGCVRFRVDPTCKRTMSDFESTKMKEDGSGDLFKEMKGENKFYTHITDGCGYGIHFLYPVTGGGWTSQEAT